MAAVRRGGHVKRKINAFACLCRRVDDLLNCSLCGEKVGASSCIHAVDRPHAPSPERLSAMRCISPSLRGCEEARLFSSQVCVCACMCVALFLVAPLLWPSLSSLSMAAHMKSCPPELPFFLKRFFFCVVGEVVREENRRRCTTPPIQGDTYLHAYANVYLCSTLSGCRCSLL